MTSDNQEPSQHQGSTETRHIDEQGKEHQLSGAEQNKRKEAVAYAAASIGLSGLKITESMRLLGERYIDGDIGLEEFVALSQQQLPL